LIGGVTSGQCRSVERKKHFVDDEKLDGDEKIPLTDQMVYKEGAKEILLSA
jgi:hypothetical protein